MSQERTVNINDNEVRKEENFNIHEDDERKKELLILMKNKREKTSKKREKEERQKKKDFDINGEETSKKNRMKLCY